MIKASGGDTPNTNLIYEHGSEEVSDPLHIAQLSPIYEALIGFSASRLPLSQLPNLIVATGKTDPQLSQDSNLC
ncbi:hypothetical protein AM228_12820 [Planktothricoides sp. SR001]|nr:hypothetical protein AM228_12820 [Planktothricoides sp. SR001]